MLEINGAFTAGTEASNGPAFGAPALRYGGFSAPFAGGQSDGVRPNWWNPGGTPAAPPSGGLLGMLQQIMTAFGNALQNGAQQMLGGQGGTAFTQATLGSVGDPHLSLSGSTADSATPIDAHFDSMVSHADLYSTNAFGGYQVATTVSAPNSNGVTTNTSATAVLDHGADAVTMSADGTLSVTSGGQSLDVAAGTSATLAGGATVTRAADGAVTIDAANPWGRSLSTTFAANGTGVDVTGQAQNVTLAGDLVSGALGSA